VFAKAPRTDRTLVSWRSPPRRRACWARSTTPPHRSIRLATTAADINFDALDAGGPARDISLRGDGQVSLEDDLIAAAKRHGRYFSPEPDPGAGHFFRADHFSFAKAGVPANLASPPDGIWSSADARRATPGTRNMSHTATTSRPTNGGRA